MVMMNDDKCDSIDDGGITVEAASVDDEGGVTVDKDGRGVPLYGRKLWILMGDK